jgi:hypothetical protein
LRAPRLGGSCTRQISIVDSHVKPAILWLNYISADVNPIYSGLTPKTVH